MANATGERILKAIIRRSMQKENAMMNQRITNDMHWTWGSGATALRKRGTLSRF